MALSAKEKRELYSSTMERLTEVIGASGKAEELVKLTTMIVQAAKKLAEGTPDPMKNRSTTTLAEFVIAAKKIAQDTRAVDSVSLQKLSSTRKAVESLMKDLDAWHSSLAPRDETDISLDDILNKTSLNSRTDQPPSMSGNGVRGSGVSPTGGVSSGSRRSSPYLVPELTEQERKLCAELKRQQEGLTKKAEPQSKPQQHGNPVDTLKVAVTGLSRSTSQLVDLAGQKSPSKEALLEPTIVLSKMVSILLDLVDSLFVTKFPMRSQVHSFCCMLIDNVLLYGEQSKTEDTASLRLVSTQAPALMSALEVMVEQCQKRSVNIRESQQMSLQRNIDLHNLDVFGPGVGPSPKNSPVTNKRKEPRKEPPTPPVKNPPPLPQDFEICVMICTSVAVDSITKSLMNKGAEITLKAFPSTKVLDIRRTLSDRTGITLNSIQLRFRGDDVLADNTLVTPNNPVPYFMFNVHEPGEEELSEFRRDQRRKNRMRIESADWSRVPSPAAVAIYDYEALTEPGEEENLEFDEGDLIEIIEKGGDGWWTGRIDGKVGVFPASFVEIIQIPKTKEEKKKLLKRYQQGRIGEENHNDLVPADDTQRQQPPPRPPEPKNLDSLSKMSSGGFKKRSQHSSTGSDNSDTGSSPSPTKKPSLFGKFERKTSDTAIDMFKSNQKSSDFGEGKDEGKSKKRRSLFKKKPPSSYMPITDDFQRSPILSYKHKDDKPTLPELEEEMVAIRPSLPATKALFRPKSSPRLAAKGIAENRPSQTDQAKQPSTQEDIKPPPLPSTDEKGDEVKARPKRRRPPPPPPPYAKKYGADGMHKMVKRRDSNEGSNTPNSERKTESKAPDPPTPSPKEEESVPVFMTVTPASPDLKRNLEMDGGNGAERNEEKVEEEGTLTSRFSSHSMEDLLKNLEEFDEFSSTQSLNKGPSKPKAPREERDYATIPRSELPAELMKDEDDDEEEEEEEEEEKEEINLRPASVPITVSSPPVNAMEDRPCLTPSPLGSVRMSATKRDPSPPSSNPSPSAAPLNEPPKPSSSPAPPIKPPRSRSKRMKMKKKMDEEEEEPNNEWQEKTTAPALDTPSQPQPAPPQPVGVPQQHSPPQWIPSSSPQVPQKPQTPPKLSRPVFHKPKPPPIPSSSPGAVENRLNQKEETKSSKPLEKKPKPPPPIAPPRKKTRSLKRPAKGESEKNPTEGVTKPPLAAKPKAIQMMQAQLEVSERPLCSSAPVSRTASPDNPNSFGVRQEVSTSVSNLSGVTAVAKGTRPGKKPTDSRESSNCYSLSYKTAIKCISYLSSDKLVREDKLISSTSGNRVLIKRLLDAINNAEDVDLNSLEEAPSVVGVLLSLFDKSHLGCLVTHDLAQQLCDSMQSADPITVLGGELEKLSPDYRELLRKLLRLFGKILKYSDKNHTGVEDIDRVFSPALFENVPSSQSQPLLAYLISTCEFVIT